MADWRDELEESFQNDADKKMLAEDEAKLKRQRAMDFMAGYQRRIGRYDEIFEEFAQFLRDKQWDAKAERLDNGGLSLVIRSDVGPLPKTATLKMNPFLNAIVFDARFGNIDGQKRISPNRQDRFLLQDLDDATLQGRLKAFVQDTIDQF